MEVREDFVEALARRALVLLELGGKERPGRQLDAPVRQLDRQRLHHSAYGVPNYNMFFFMKPFLDRKYIYVELKVQKYKLQSINFITDFNFTFFKIIQ